MSRCLSMYVSYVLNVPFVKGVVNVRAIRDTVAMDKPRTTGEILLEIKERSGLTLDQIAAGADYKGRSSVQLYFSPSYDALLSPKAATRLAKAFDGTGSPPIHRNEVTALVGFEPTSNATPFKMEGASLVRMEENLPIFGTALGAAQVVEGEAIEQTMLNSGEIIGYAKRPTMLDGRADAYGLYVQGSSMYPAYAEGAFLVAEGKKPPRVGDDVVVYLRARDEEDHDVGEDRVRLVMVKRLVRRSHSFLELEQFTPPLKFRIDATDVLRIDRILTMSELLVE